MYREENGIKYYDVEAAAGKKYRGDYSSFFPEDAEGYYLRSGVFTVDEDTMRRVIKKPCIGNGALKWNRYRVESYMERPNPDPFDGVLPVSKIGDPLYECMCLPNEQHSPMDTRPDGTINWEGGRINAANLYDMSEPYRNALPIGAIFVNVGGKELPDDAQVTLCFEKIKLCVRTKDSDGWFVGSERLCVPTNFYPFPWQLGSAENPIDSYRLDGKFSEVDGHCELKMSGAELKGKNFKDPRVRAGIIHFWGDFYRFENGENVIGMAPCYTVWVKEPEWSGCLTADIGIDIRMADGYCDQAITGINFAITDKPRVVFGHDVGPKAYDKIMDSEAVQKLMGLKK